MKEAVIRNDESAGLNHEYPVNGGDTAYFVKKGRL